MNDKTIQILEVWECYAYYYFTLNAKENPIFLDNNVHIYEICKN